MKYKTIKKYPKYKIGQDGTVKRKSDGFKKKPIIKSKYLRVHVRDIKGKVKLPRINRLVALAFIPNPLNLPEVNHLDGNKLNNWDWNLEWSTKSGNLKHAFDAGLRMGRLLTKEDKNKAMKLSKDGGTRVSIAKELGISKRSVGRLLLGLWKG